MDFRNLGELENNRKKELEFKSIDIKEINVLKDDAVFNKEKKISKALSKLNNGNKSEKKIGRPKKDVEEIKSYRISFYLTEEDFKKLLSKNVNDYDISYFLRNEIINKIIS